VFENWVIYASKGSSGLAVVDVFSARKVVVRNFGLRLELDCVGLHFVNGTVVYARQTTNNYTHKIKIYSLRPKL